ncbi:unnamed protein product [Zymoseptoria tritici ST99CH_1E4]|nr:unnamed protein product [Zymoseptoria tritici ST99CH_1E4]
MKHEYPKPVMPASICMPPIAQLDKRTRKEAVDVVHRDTRLYMRPRLGYVLPHIPHALIRAMPIFARSVAFLHVTVDPKTPELFLATLGCGTDRASEARFVFAMRGRTISVEASIMDPQTEVARVELLAWMKAKALELMAAVKEYLEGELADEKKTLTKQPGGPVLRFTLK